MEEENKKEPYFHEIISNGEKKIFRISPDMFIDVDLKWKKVKR